jgi:hypothetical protein
MLSLQKELNCETGTTFAYSNSNYFLLAEIVHRVSGMSFSDFTREKIFAPLGMQNTWFCDTYERIVKNRAESYELTGSQYFHKSLLDSSPGASNLLTTAEDLSKWVVNFEKPIVGNNSIMEAFNHPSYLDNGKKVIFRVEDDDTIFYAKGQNISKFKGGYLGHGGHTAGFRTFLGRFPNQRLAIIQLSNDEDHERLGGRWNFADYYIQYPVESKKQTNVPVTKPQVTGPPAKFTTDLAGFTGDYLNDVLDTRYHFDATAGRLIMKHKRLHDIILKRTGENRFSGYGPNTFAFEIEFMKNEMGKVTGFDISNWGAKHLKFVRQQE